MKAPKVDFVYDENGIAAGIVVGLGPGAVGWSRRMPEDNMNAELGMNIALGRAQAAREGRVLRDPPKVMRAAYNKMCKMFPRGRSIKELAEVWKMLRNGQIIGPEPWISVPRSPYTHPVPMLRPNWEWQPHQVMCRK